MQNYRIFISIFVSFVLGLAIAGSMTYLTLKRQTTEKEVHAGPQGFINPLIDCSSWTDTLPPKANELRDRLTAYISQSIANGKTDKISIFYRDLLNGPQFDIGGEEKFAAASLLKIPILIYYFKLSETTSKDILKEKILYQEKTIISKYAVQLVDPPPQLVEGIEYPVDELLGRMIQYSDNVSTELLLKHRPDLNIPQLLLDMGISLQMVDGDYWISVRGNAALFRILYNATYLNKANSQAALQLLSISGFRKGLRAGVDPNTIVASKFGEREVGESSQLHDCGIVYHPSRPYIACIMTRGKNVGDLTTSIKDISAIIYNEIH